jgi:predicted nucleic acid-binding Zn ribbon protein
MPRENDYECHDCALVFTARVPTDGPRPICPYCQSPNVSWKPTCIAVQKKGDGWTPIFYGEKEKD